MPSPPVGNESQIRKDHGPIRGQTSHDRTEFPVSDIRSFVKKPEYGNDTREPGTLPTGETAASVAIKSYLDGTTTKSMDSYDENKQYGEDITYSNDQALNDLLREIEQEEAKSTIFFDADGTALPSVLKATMDVEEDEQEKTAMEEALEAEYAIRTEEAGSS